MEERTLELFLKFVKCYRKLRFGQVETRRFGDEDIAGLGNDMEMGKCKVYLQPPSLSEVCRRQLGDEGEKM